MGHVGEPAPVPTEITLHSSWRGLVSSSVGGGVILLGGLVGVSLGGFRFFPTFLLVLGLFLSAVVVFDYPVATRFTTAGLERRMMLRHQNFPWDRVRQLTRARPGLARGLRGLEHGGLAVVVGKRKYLLVDQPESPEEFDVVYALVGEERAHDMGLHNRIRPHDGTNPTWIYRRSKWAPDSATDVGS
jgi:hypothetical protein